MSNMNKLAKSIIAIVNEEHYGLNWLQLNLVLYFTIIDGIEDKIIDKEYLIKLYDEKFQKRKDYPIIPSVFNEYKYYGPTLIIENEKFNEKFLKLKNIIINLLQVSTIDLWDEARKHKIFNKEQQLYEIEDLFEV